MYVITAIFVATKHVRFMTAIANHNYCVLKFLIPLAVSLYWIDH